jgi:hypothetical protein
MVISKASGEWDRCGKATGYFRRERLITSVRLEPVPGTVWGDLIEGLISSFHELLPLSWFPPLSRERVPPRSSAARG